MQTDGLTVDSPVPATETPAPPAPRSVPLPPQQLAAAARRPAARMAAPPRPDPGLLGAAVGLAGDTRVLLAALAGWMLAGRFLRGRRRRAAPPSSVAAALEGEMARLRASLSLLRDDNDELAAQVAQLRTGLAKARRGGVPKALAEVFDGAAGGGGVAAAAPAPAQPPPEAPGAAALVAPPVDGADPETPQGRGAAGTSPLGAVLVALEQLREENAELRGAVAALRAENAELAERMVEVAFTGAGGVENGKEAAGGGPSPLGEWAAGGGAASEGGAGRGPPPGAPAPQGRLDAANTVCSGVTGCGGAILEGPAGPGTPGLPSEWAADRDTSNAKSLQRYVHAAAYLED